MKDLLPNAGLTITVPPLEFFQNIASVAKQRGQRAVQSRRPGPQGDTDILTLYPAKASKHKGLFVQLIHSTTSRNRISAEARATSWNTQGEMTYDIYAEALKSVIQKPLSTYNKKHGTRYRLTIQSKKACEHKLSPKARMVFELFTRSANQNCHSTVEWTHFYRFAKICHSSRAATNEENVFRLFVHGGILESIARSHASLFGHLREFQRM